MLKETFVKLVTNYTDNEHQITIMWAEIEEAYSSNGRYYHTLVHLEDLLIQLTEVKKHIRNWKATLFALYYHDIIYDVSQSDNEEKSAILAEKRMGVIGVPHEEIKQCTLLILSSKSHQKSTDTDSNYFTDADLSILGQQADTYTCYYKNVKKEYAIYSDIYI